MSSCDRYVAIGDSTTEGLEDPDGQGGYRGWADRLAELIARGHDGPLEYANLAVRGLRLREIRETQLDQALALRPDVMTIVGGVNDVIGPPPDFTTLRADLAEMFGRATDQGVTVLTFTMPDPTSINPLGRLLRGRMNTLNDLIREEAARTGALVMDFQQYPKAEDLRLWFEDRLHANPVGHALIAEALAWRLGIDGVDGSWSDPFPEGTQPPSRVPLAADLEWVVNYLIPWLGQAIRGIPPGRDIVAKRPVPTVVELVEPDHS